MKAFLFPKCPCGRRLFSTHTHTDTQTMLWCIDQYKDTQTHTPTVTSKCRWVCRGRGHSEKKKTFIKPIYLFSVTLSGRASLCRQTAEQNGIDVFVSIPQFGHGAWWAAVGQAKEGLSDKEILVREREKLYCDACLVTFQSLCREGHLCGSDRVNDENAIDQPRHGNDQQLQKYLYRCIEISIISAQCKIEEYGFTHRAEMRWDAMRVAECWTPELARHLMQRFLTVVSFCAR